MDKDSSEDESNAADGIGREGSSHPSRGSNSEKLLNLLMVFATQSDPWTVDDLVQEFDLPVSSIYRYLKSLSDVGLVVAVSAGSYILGPSIIMLDRQMRLSDPLVESARLVKASLASALPKPGTVLLCRLFRNSVMCIDSTENGKLGFDVSYARGRPLPLYRGAASKAILSQMPLRTVRGLYARESADFAGAGLGEDWTDVKASLRKIRKDNVSVTYGELDRNAIGVASPVLSYDGQIQGSLGYVALRAQTDPAALSVIVEQVKSGALGIQKSYETMAQNRI